MYALENGIPNGAPENQKQTNLRFSEKNNRYFFVGKQKKNFIAKIFFEKSQTGKSLEKFPSEKFII